METLFSQLSEIAKDMREKNLDPSKVCTLVPTFHEQAKACFQVMDEVFAKSQANPQQVQWQMNTIKTAPGNELVALASAAGAALARAEQLAEPLKSSSTSTTPQQQQQQHPIAAIKKMSMQRPPALARRSASQ
ncbi:hypothetical protein AMTRI_Chr04g185920 [Amborella trichopoda]